MSLLRSSSVVTVIALVAFSAAAQNRRTKPKPLATPPPVLTGAEIISQGGEYVEPQQEAQPPADTQPVRQTGTNTARIRDLNERLSKLESQKGTQYDEAQKRMLLNLDILTRAEQRVESLRKQLFEMIEKENAIRVRLDQIEYDSRPEVIERTTVQMGGSLRPEEIRETRRKSLDAERRNLQSLLTQIQSTRTSLETNLARAEQMVDRLRARVEKDIDDALVTEERTPE